MYAETLTVRPGVGVAGPVVAAHLAALAMLVLLPTAHGAVKVVLVALLALGLAVSCGRLRRYSRWSLCAGPEGWQLVQDGQAIAVGCEFLFVSPWLVTARVRPVGRRGAFHLMFTPRGCRSDHWRRLHRRAREGLQGSAVADNDVLGGKVDGHKNGVAGNR